MVVEESLPKTFLLTAAVQSLAANDVSDFNAWHDKSLMRFHLIRSTIVPALADLDMRSALVYPTVMSRSSFLAHWPMT